MTSRYQTCECKSTSPPVKDFPHLALLVNNNEEETISELPMCPKQVDEICNKSPKRVFLHYTTLNTEAISAESAPETIRVIGYQEEWERKVEIWFENNNYEPVEHHTLDSEFFPNCYQGLDRLAAYAYQLDYSRHAWYMKKELERSSATLSSHLWVFDLSTRFCATCRCHYHKAQEHKCDFHGRKCKTCRTIHHGVVNLKRHYKFKHQHAKSTFWDGIEVEVMYNLHLIGYSAHDIAQQIPGRTISEWEDAIKDRKFGCSYCPTVLTSRRAFNHHAKFHPQEQTAYHCYKCDRLHELGKGRIDVCLGKQHKLDLRNREEVNAFCEMQFMVLLQVDCPGSPRFWLESDGSKMADEEPFEFVSRLSTFLRNTIQDEVVLTRLRILYQANEYKFERHVLDQLLKVVQSEKLVSQGKEDSYIHVSCGNIDWYMNLQSKARRGDKRPRLSAISMGFVI